MNNDNHGVSTAIIFNSKETLEALNKVLNTLTNITEQIDKIITNTNKSSNTTKKITKDVNVMDKILKGLSFGAITQSFKQLTKNIMDSTQKFADYIEDLNVLKVAFEDTADEAKNMVENIASITGYDEATLVRMTATFRQLSSTLGLANKDADLLSTNLTKMALDISSLYNLDLNTAKYALQGALTAQPRSIKTHTGADITQDTLQAELARLGIDKKVRSLSQAEQAIVTYLSLERQLINSNGDLARTIEQPANMLRIFKEQVTRAGRSLGNLFLPIIKTVIPYLTAFLMVFSEIVNVITSFFNIDVDSFWESMESGTGNISNNLNGIAEGAKKAQMGLRGFDKLNVIKTPSSSDSNGLGLGIDSRLLEALDDYDLKLEGIRTKATEIRDRIMEWLGFSQILNEDGELIGWKYEGIQKTLENIAKSFWELPTAGKLLLGLGLIALFRKMYNWVKKIMGLASLKTIKNLFDYAVKRGLEPALDFTVKLMSPIERIAGAIGGLVGMVVGISGIVNSVRDIATEGLNASNGMELLLSGISLVTGAIVLMTTATGAFKIEMALATGGITLLVGAVIGLIEYFTTSKKTTDENAEATQKYKEKLEELEDTIANKMVETYAQAGRAEDLKAKLEDLVDTNGKVKGSHEEVEAILKELNEIMGTNYALTDGQITLDGKLIDKKSELIDTVEQYIDKLKAEALIEASREKIQAIYERNLELKKQEKTLMEELKEKAKEYNLTTKEGAEQFAIDNADTLSDLREIQSELKTNDNQLSLYAKGAMEAEKGHFGKAEEYMLTTAETAKTTITDIYEELVDNFNKEFSTTVEAKVKVNTTEYKKWLKDVQANNNGILYSQVLGSTAFASGGFPETGQYFLARENGPELVGSIGNKTAVANNQQIVDAVSQGVKNAILASGGFGKNKVVIEAHGDADGMMNFITFKQKEQDMQYGN